MLLKKSREPAPTDPLSQKTVVRTVKTVFYVGSSVCMLVRDVYMRKTPALLIVLPVLGFLTIVFAIPVAAAPRHASPQGCVNQGQDQRMGGWAVCWAQRHLSWKSERKPHFFLIGRPKRTSLGVAWPPYIVYNSPQSKGRWRMFRIGFRYDRNWQGYIFPTAAWKTVTVPLQY